MMSQSEIKPVIILPITLLAVVNSPGLKGFVRFCHFKLFTWPEVLGFVILNCSPGLKGFMSL
jgi:hypothetical protein